VNDYPPIPPDDLQRHITVAQPDKDQNLAHLGIVGDTYTILVTGDDTNGRFCLIDMHIPPGGGPPLHRHDFEETFMMLEGELEVTFRGKKSTVHAGDTVNIPSNAPHQFHNGSGQPVRLLCLCSPSGWRTSSKKLECPLRLELRRPPSSRRRGRRSLRPSILHFRRSIEQSCSNTPSVDA
jgi:quercetin dioxygenase-like cupin family protein